MKLLKLTLENFAGIKSFELNAEGRSLSIYGDNGTGKTTLADAQAWLLFGKDSALTPGFDPKPRDKQGRELHNIETAVRGVYDMDGARVTLEKVRAEDWKKKRGSTEAVFSGHTISYYIDGVPKKEKEYQEYLSGALGDAELLMLLTLPRYFSEVLDIRSRREMLMTLTDDPDVQEVIDSDPDLSPMESLLKKPENSGQRYTAAEFLKISKATLSQCNGELKILPERIDEASRALEDCGDPDKLREQIADLEKHLEDEEDAIRNSAASASKALAEAKADLEQLRAEHLAENSALSESIEQEYSVVLSRRSAATREREEKLSRLRNAQLRHRDMKDLRETLLAKWKEVSGRVWAGDGVCPTCGQPIPEEQLEADRERFNAERSKLLDRLNKQGQETCSAPMLEELQGEIDKLTAEAKQLEEQVNALTRELESISLKRRELPAFEDTEDYRAAREKISQIQEQLRSDRGADETDRLRKELSQLRTELARCDANDRARQRIRELEQRQAEVSEAYVNAEMQVGLAELFIRTKAELVTRSINGQFSAVSFRLFKTQINGGIQDDCETMCRTTAGQIPYSSANNAARVNAGLDIISTFARAGGLTVPVFVDNAESVTCLDVSGLQIIRLVVSEKDKQLRIEED